MGPSQLSERLNPPNSYDRVIDRATENKHRTGCMAHENLTKPGISSMTKNATAPSLLRLYKPGPESRRDWSEIRGRIDLAKVAAALLGAPVERRGLSSGSLGWCCPFHPETIPSFRIILGEVAWSCSTCGAGGDAAALVMRIKSVGFHDAVAWLDEDDWFNASKDLTKNGRNASPALPGPTLRRDP
jgi:hypothetical protein